MNGWRLEMTDRAMENMADIPANQLPAIVRAIRLLAREPSGPHIKKLHAKTNTWRMRVGNWRVLFEFKQSEHMLKIPNITDRKDAYCPIFLVDMVGARLKFATHMRVLLGQNFDLKVFNLAPSGRSVSVLGT